MERMTLNGHSNSLEEIFHFAKDQVDQMISNVLQSLQPSTPIIHSMRCRSISQNDRRERNISFHHTMPRCSLPATRTNLFSSHSRSLSYQPLHARSFQNVQYSFSLNQLWLTKLNQERRQLLSVQNFVHELVEHSIRTALLQVGSTSIDIHSLFLISFIRSSDRLRTINQ